MRVLERVKVNKWENENLIRGKMKKIEGKGNFGAGDLKVYSSGLSHAITKKKRRKKESLLWWSYKTLLQLAYCGVILYRRYSICGK